jgi:hypothetical protein
MFDQIYEKMECFSKWFIFLRHNALPLNAAKVAALKSTVNAGFVAI